jgi:hypothetical protein
MHSGWRQIAIFPTKPFTPKAWEGLRTQVPTLRTMGAMWLIILEALGALALLVLIVWWTMFSGRKGGEAPTDDER